MLMAFALLLVLFGIGSEGGVSAEAVSNLCDCCDESTLHAYAGELNRHCLPASLLRKKQDIIVGESLDGSPSVPEEALNVLCASALCRSSVLRYWARVRGCSESSSWKRFGFAWAAAKVRCMRLPQEREPQDGARYQVLMQATFRREGQVTDAAGLEVLSTAIKEALLGSMWRAPQALTAPREGLRVQVAMAAYGPPIRGPVAFEMATPETASCPQMVTTFPWDGEVSVKPGLHYAILHFDRCVMLRDKLTATLLGTGTPQQQGSSPQLREGTTPPPGVEPSLPSSACRRDLLSASLPVSQAQMPGRTLIFHPDKDLQAGCCYRFHLEMEAVISCNSQTPLCEDLKIDFCVKLAPPSPTIKWVSPKAADPHHSFRQEHISGKVLLTPGARSGGPGTSWPRRLQAEGPSLDAWRQASPVNGNPVEPDLEVSIALTCPYHPDSSDRLSEADAGSCAGIREKMLNSLLTPESGFYSVLAAETKLQLLNFAPPHIIQVLSDCPPIEKIEQAVLQMNAACNFHDGTTGEDLYTSSTAFLRSHLFQSQLGVEMLTQHLRKQVCQRPLCRGYAELLRQGVKECPEDAGHKGIVARVARAVDTTMASCLEVHSASQGDASHSEVASGQGGSVTGVWSSDMSEKNHILVAGIDTGSPAEMRAVEVAVGRILADELQLPLFAFEERGQSLADIFDPVLGGPNVFAVTDARLRVAAQLTPLPSGEPFDESVGRFDEAAQEIPVKQNSFVGEQHNLQMLAIQPGWSEQGIDPSRVRIRVIFEDIVTKDDPSAVIRIFPVALRDICMSLKPDDQLQWQMFPADSGLGSLEPARGEGDADPLDGVPVGFVCHTIAAGDDVQVLASGEALQIEVLQPLLRNTQYVVLLPPRVVKAAMGSTAFPGALWEGWPSEEGQGNKEYVFTTGVPKASFARLSIAVSCSSEEECQRQRGLVSEQGMEDLASRALCFAAWFRCNEDPVAQKHCEIPDQGMQWCDPHGSWAPSWSPPRKKEDFKLSGVPDQAVSEVQSIRLPNWVYIVALAAWVQGTFGTLRAAWWVSDLYTQSRDFDPYVSQGSRSLPLKACVVSMAIPVLVGILGALFAAPTFRLAVHTLWAQSDGSQQGALVDADRLHHQLAAAFATCFCASEAFTAMFAYSLIARFKNWVADKGQLISIGSVCCAAAGAAGGACGWVASSGVRHMTHPSLGLALGIVVLLMSAMIAQILSLTIVPGAIFGLLWEMPGIGDILSHAVKYQTFQWRKWFENGRESGSWSDFVLLIADIEVDEGFVQSMLNMGMDDGHLFIKFYCSETPQDVSATRSHAVQWEGADDGLVQKFDGEDIFVNFTNPLALLRVDVMFQEEAANRPECVATTIWDPWCADLLSKYFSNFPLCDARSEHTDFWNPKDVFHPDGRPIDGVFLELELNLTRHRTDCSPEMGFLRFHATHMGGFGSKRQSRVQPWEKPEKLLALGDTIAGRNHIYWRRPVVDVKKADFQSGRFQRAAEEEEEERRRMAHRQQLRYQLENQQQQHQQHQQHPAAHRPHSPPLRPAAESGHLPPFITFSGSGGARPVAVQPYPHETDDCSPTPSLMSDFLNDLLGPAPAVEPAHQYRQILPVATRTLRPEPRALEAREQSSDWLSDTLESLGLVVPSPASSPQGRR